MWKHELTCVCEVGGGRKEKEREGRKSVFYFIMPNIPFSHTPGQRNLLSLSRSVTVHLCAKKVFLFIFISKLCTHLSKL